MMRSQTPGAWRRRVGGRGTRLDRAPGLREWEYNLMLAHPVDVVNFNENYSAALRFLPAHHTSPHRREINPDHGALALPDGPIVDGAVRRKPRFSTRRSRYPGSAILTCDVDVETAQSLAAQSGIRRFARRSARMRRCCSPGLGGACSSMSRAWVPTSITCAGG